MAYSAKTHEDIMQLFVAKRILKFHTDGSSGIRITQKQYKWLVDVYTRITGDEQGEPKGDITVNGKTIIWWINPRCHTVVKMKMMSS